MGDSSTVYNALSGTQAVMWEGGPGTYSRAQSEHGFALATDLKPIGQPARMGSGRRGGVAVNE